MGHRVEKRENISLTSMKGMLKFWEETKMKKEKSDFMVTLKGLFKGETGEKWHMLTLLYITDSGIKVSRWVYLDSVWCTIHSRGMLKWIYWD